MWEDLKDIRAPMYDRNPLKLNRFLQKLHDQERPLLRTWIPPRRINMYLNASDGACQRCFRTCTSWKPKR